MTSVALSHLSQQAVDVAFEKLLDVQRELALLPTSNERPPSLQYGASGAKAIHHPDIVEAAAKRRARLLGWVHGTISLLSQLYACSVIAQSPSATKVSLSTLAGAAAAMKQSRQAIEDIDTAAEIFQMTLNTLGAVQVGLHNGLLPQFDTAGASAAAVGRGATAASAAAAVSLYRQGNAPAPRSLSDGVIPALPNARALDAVAALRSSPVPFSSAVSSFSQASSDQGHLALVRRILHSSVHGQKLFSSFLFPPSLPLHHVAWLSRAVLSPSSSSPSSSLAGEGIKQRLGALLSPHSVEGFARVLMSETTALRLLLGRHQRHTRIIQDAAATAGAGAAPGKTVVAHTGRGTMLVVVPGAFAVELALLRRQHYKVAAAAHKSLRYRQSNQQVQALLAPVLGTSMVSEPFALVDFVPLATTGVFATASSSSSPVSVISAQAMAMAEPEALRSLVLRPGASQLSAMQSALQGELMRATRAAAMRTQVWAANTEDSEANKSWGLPLDPLASGPSDAGNTSATTTTKKRKRLELELDPSFSRSTAAGSFLLTSVTTESLNAQTIALIRGSGFSTAAGQSERKASQEASILLRDSIAAAAAAGGGGGDNVTTMLSVSVRIPDEEQQVARRWTSGSADDDSEGGALRVHHLKPEIRLPSTPHRDLLFQPLADALFSTLNSLASSSVSSSSSSSAPSPATSASASASASSMFELAQKVAALEVPALLHHHDDEAPADSSFVGGVEHPSQPQSSRQLAVAGEWSSRVWAAAEKAVTATKACSAGVSEKRGKSGDWYATLWSSPATSSAPAVSGGGHDEMRAQSIAAVLRAFADAIEDAARRGDEGTVAILRGWFAKHLAQAAAVPNDENGDTDSAVSPGQGALAASFFSSAPAFVAEPLRMAAALHESLGPRELLSLLTSADSSFSSSAGMGSKAAAGSAASAEPSSAKRRKINDDDDELAHSGASEAVRKASDWADEMLKGRGDALPFAQTAEADGDGDAVFPVPASLHRRKAALERSLLMQVVTAANGNNRNGSDKRHHAASAAAVDVLLRMIAANPAAAVQGLLVQLAPQASPQKPAVSFVPFALSLLGIAVPASNGPSAAESSSSEALSGPLFAELSTLAVSSAAGKKGGKGKDADEIDAMGRVLAALTRVARLFSRAPSTVTGSHAAGSLRHLLPSSSFSLVTQFIPMMAFRPAIGGNLHPLALRLMSGSNSANGLVGNVDGIVYGAFQRAADNIYRSLEAFAAASPAFANVDLQQLPGNEKSNRALAALATVRPASIPFATFLRRFTRATGRRGKGSGAEAASSLSSSSSFTAPSPLSALSLTSLVDLIADSAIRPLFARPPVSQLVSAAAVALVSASGNGGVLSSSLSNSSVGSMASASSSLLFLGLCESPLLDPYVRSGAVSSALCIAALFLREVAKDCANSVARHIVLSNPPPLPPQATTLTPSAASSVPAFSPLASPAAAVAEWTAEKQEELINTFSASLRVIVEAACAKVLGEALLAMMPANGGLYQRLRGQSSAASDAASKADEDRRPPPTRITAAAAAAHILSPTVCGALPAPYSCLPAALARQAFNLPALGNGYIVPPPAQGDSDDDEEGEDERGSSKMSASVRSKEAGPTASAGRKDGKRISNRPALVSRRQFAIDVSSASLSATQSSLSQEAKAAIEGSAGAGGVVGGAAPLVSSASDESGRQMTATLSTASAAVQRALTDPTLSDFPLAIVQLVQNNDSGSAAVRSAFLASSLVSLHAAETIVDGGHADADADADASPPSETAASPLTASSMGQESSDLAPSASFRVFPLFNDAPTLPLPFSLSKPYAPSLFASAAVIANGRLLRTASRVLRSRLDLQAAVAAAPAAEGGDRGFSASLCPVPPALLGISADELQDLGFYQRQSVGNGKEADPFGAVFDAGCVALEAPLAGTTKLQIWLDSTSGLVKMRVDRGAAVTNYEHAPLDLVAAQCQRHARARIRRRLRELHRAFLQSDEVTNRNVLHSLASEGTLASPSSSTSSSSTASSAGEQGSAISSKAVAEQASGDVFPSSLPVSSLAAACILPFNPLAAAGAVTACASIVANSDDDGSGSAGGMDVDGVGGSDSAPTNTNTATFARLGSLRAGLLRRLRAQGNAVVDDQRDQRDDNAASGSSGAAGAGGVTAKQALSLLPLYAGGSLARSFGSGAANAGGADAGSTLQMLGLAGVSIASADSSSSSSRSSANSALSGAMSPEEALRLLATASAGSIPTETASALLQLAFGAKGDSKATDATQARASSSGSLSSSAASSSFITGGISSTLTSRGNNSLLLTSLSLSMQHEAEVLAILASKGWHSIEGRVAGVANALISQAPSPMLLQRGLATALGLGGGAGMNAVGGRAEIDLLAPVVEAANYFALSTGASIARVSRKHFRQAAAVDSVMRSTAADAAALGTTAATSKLQAREKAYRHAKGLLAVTELIEREGGIPSGNSSAGTQPADADGALVGVTTASAATAKACAAAAVVVAEECARAVVLLRRAMLVNQKIAAPLFDAFGRNPSIAMDSRAAKGFALLYTAFSKPQLRAAEGTVPLFLAIGAKETAGASSSASAAPAKAGSKRSRKEMEGDESSALSLDIKASLKPFELPSSAIVLPVEAVSRAAALASNAANASRLPFYPRSCPWRFHLALDAVDTVLATPRSQIMFGMQASAHLLASSPLAESAAVHLFAGAFVKATLSPSGAANLFAFVKQELARKRAEAEAASQRAALLSASAGATAASSYFSAAVGGGGGGGVAQGDAAAGATGTTGQTFFTDEALGIGKSIFARPAADNKAKRPPMMGARPALGGTAATAAAAAMTSGTVTSINLPLSLLRQKAAANAVESSSAKLSLVSDKVEGGTEAHGLACRSYSGQRSDSGEDAALVVPLFCLELSAKVAAAAAADSSGSSSNRAATLILNRERTEDQLSALQSLAVEAALLSAKSALLGDFKALSSPSVALSSSLRPAPSGTRMANLSTTPSFARWMDRGLAASIFSKLGLALPSSLPSYYPDGPSVPQGDSGEVLLLEVPSWLFSFFSSYGGGGAVGTDSGIIGGASLQASVLLEVLSSSSSTASSSSSSSSAFSTSTKCLARFGAALSAVLSGASATQASAVVLLEAGPSFPSMPQGTTKGAAAFGAAGSSISASAAPFAAKVSPLSAAGSASFACSCPLAFCAKGAAASALRQAALATATVLGAESSLAPPSSFSAAAAAGTSTIEARLIDDGSAIELLFAPRPPLVSLTVTAAVLREETAEAKEAAAEGLSALVPAQRDTGTLCAAVAIVEAFDPLASGDGGPGGAANPNPFDVAVQRSKAAAREIEDRYQDAVKQALLSLPQ